MVSYALTLLYLFLATITTLSQLEQCDSNIDCELKMFSQTQRDQPMSIQQRRCAAL